VAQKSDGSGGNVIELLASEQASVVWHSGCKRRAHPALHPLHTFYHDPVVQVFDIVPLHIDTDLMTSWNSLMTDCTPTSLIHC